MDAIGLNVNMNLHFQTKYKRYNNFWITLIICLSKENLYKICSEVGTNQHIYNNWICTKYENMDYEAIFCTIFEISFCMSLDRALPVSNTSSWLAFWSESNSITQQFVIRDIASTSIPQWRATMASGTVLIPTEQKINSNYISLKI